MGGVGANTTSKWWGWWYTTKGKIRFFSRSSAIIQREHEQEISMFRTFSQLIGYGQGIGSE